MKIKRGFIEDFFNGNKQLEALGMQVLYLNILFAFHKGIIPISVLFETFTKEDIEYFINCKLIRFDQPYAYQNDFNYIEGGL